MYTTRNFKTKKALRAAALEGLLVIATGIAMTTILFILWY